VPGHTDFISIVSVVEKKVWIKSRYDFSEF